jgi:hypothetical protein
MPTQMVFCQEKYEKYEKFLGWQATVITTLLPAKRYPEGVRTLNLIYQQVRLEVL